MPTGTFTHTKQAQVAGLDNPLNKMVQDACKAPDVLLGDDGDDLYMEYGGFKFAAEEVRNACRHQSPD
jgi:hypothetical protein